MTALDLPSKSESYAEAVWRRFRRHKLAVVGLVVLAVLYASAVFAPWIAPYDPDEPDLAHALAPPSAAHIMGTDNYGRDEFSRALFGGRISLSVGLVAVGIALTIGVLIGAVAGYYGGLVDNLLMRLVDVVISFPVLFLLVTVVAVIGPSIFNIMVVIGLTGWTGVARLVRGQFLSLRRQDFVEGARALGAGDARLIFGHILPNALAAVIVAGTLGVGGAILTESALSYLGLGVQPPTPSWGNMLYDGQGYIRQAWWMTVFPGFFIFLTLVSINLVGDALRDALDPHQDRA